MSKIELCKVPDTLKFQFLQDQEMHATINIENLLNKVVNYKIKTNKPGLYLVKPMDGQIISKGSATIAFKRKELTLDNFNMIQNNPGQAREKFLVEISSELEDSVGILKKVEQVAILGVTYTRAQVESTAGKTESINWNEGKTRKDRSIDKKADFTSIIAQKREQLEKLIVNRQTLQARSAGSSLNTFTLTDLINVLVVVFLLGFVIV